MSSPARPFLDMVAKMIRGDIPPAPIAETIGMRVAEVRPDFAVFEMEAGRRHANPMGTLHGGVLCDLADGAMGVAWASGLGEGESFTTLELKINFLRPVLDASIETRARVVHAGKSLVYLECDVVVLADEKLVAKASSTCLILRGEQARGR